MVKWSVVIPLLLLMALLSGCGNVCFSYGVRSCARPIPHQATPLFGVWLSEDPNGSRVKRIEVNVYEGSYQPYARIWETCAEVECPFSEAEASSASGDGDEPGIEVHLIGDVTSYNWVVHVRLFLLSSNRAQAEVTFYVVAPDGGVSLGTNTYFFYRAL